MPFQAVGLCVLDVWEPGKIRHVEIGLGSSMPALEFVHLHFERWQSDDFLISAGLAGGGHIIQFQLFPEGPLEEIVVQ